MRKFSTHKTILFTTIALGNVVNAQTSIPADAPVAAGLVAPPAPSDAKPAPAPQQPEAPDTLKPPTWKQELVGNFNIASTYYDDWSKGGEDNVAWNFNLKGRLERDDSVWNWTNTGLAKFGQVKLGGQAIRKTDDELNAETVLSRKLSKYVNPYVSASFKTQFSRSYLYPSDTTPPVSVSNFLDPLYLVQSAGVGSRPLDWLRTRLGAAVHEVRTDEYRAWSNGPNSTGGKAWKVEGGVEWITDLKKNLADHLLLESSLATFSNLKGWDEVVLDWTSIASYQFTKYVNVNASGELRRDLQQFDGWQWKHQISLGLTCSFL